MDRTRNYFNQVTGSIVYKFFSVIASFFAIPLMIASLGLEKFGIWSTLLTILNWFIFFDLGLGNGLRNRVAERLSLGDSLEAKHYISSAYSFTAIFAVVIWIALYIASYFVPWQAAFNTKTVSEELLRNSFVIASFFILINFCIGLITALLGAVQRSAMVAFGQMFANICILAFLVVGQKNSIISIFSLSVIYGVSIVFGNLVLSYLFFSLRTELLPRINFSWAIFKPLIAPSLRFFVIQLAALVLFTTDKLIISGLFGPMHVAEYEIVFKLFGIITLVHALVSAPLWSAYTEAYTKGEINWIKVTLNRQILFVVALAGFSALLVYLSGSIIKLWIREEVPISFHLTISMGIFVVLTAWNNVFATLVNGLGKIGVQFYASIVVMILNIPLSIYFARVAEFGVSGVVIGTLVSMLIGAILLPIHVLLILKKET